MSNPVDPVDPVDPADQIKALPFPRTIGANEFADIIGACARMDFKMGWERIWRAGEYAQGREWQDY